MKSPLKFRGGEVELPPCHPSGLGVGGPGVGEWGAALHAGRVRPPAPLPGSIQVASPHLFPSIGIFILRGIPADRPGGSPAALRPARPLRPPPIPGRQT